MNTFGFYDTDDTVKADPIEPVLIERGLTYNTYDKGDGNYTSMFSGGPINYPDLSDPLGWSPINTSFYMLPPEHYAYEYGYRAGNDHGLFSVYFKEFYGEEYPTVFAYEKSDLIEALQSKLFAFAYIDPSDPDAWEYTILEETLNVTGVLTGEDNDVARYDDIVPGINATWRYTPEGLKEEITLSPGVKTFIEDNPPSDYGMSNTDTYVAMVTKLQYANLSMYDGVVHVVSNYTVDELGLVFKDILGEIMFTMPIGYAWTEDQEFNTRVPLTYCVLVVDNQTYLLSGMKAIDLYNMVFPVVFDPTTEFGESPSNYNSHMFNLSPLAWSTIRGATSTTHGYDTDIGIFAVYEDVAQYKIGRGRIFFNTSSLSDDAVISEAKINFTISSHIKYDNNICVISGMPNRPTDSTTTTDWNLALYTLTNLGNTTVTSTGSKQITLTEGGRATINKTGITKYLMMNKNFDFDNIAPTDLNEAMDFIADENLVKLWVTHSPGNTAPVMDSFNVDTESGANLGWDWDNNDVQVDCHYTDAEEQGSCDLLFTYSLGGSARTPTTADYDGIISSTGNITNYDLNWVNTAGWTDYAGTVEIRVRAWDGTDYSSTSLSSTALTEGIDGTTPSTSVDSIGTYVPVADPLILTYTVTDSPASSMDIVELDYNYSHDNVSWSGWTIDETDYGSPWGGSFNYPSGSGYYQLATFGSDVSGRTETISSYDIRFRWGTPPALSNEDPTDGSTVDYPQPECSVYATDADYDTLTLYLYENSTGSWVLRETESGGSGSVYADFTYTLATENQEYYWRACVTDGYFWTNDTYSFNLYNDPPALDDETPDNESTITYTAPSCSVRITDANYDNMDYYLYQNSSGSWILMESGVNIGSGSYINFDYLTATTNGRYWWRANVTDGNSWVNETYWFDIGSTTGSVTLNCFDMESLVPIKYWTYVVTGSATGTIANGVNVSNPQTLNTSSWDVNPYYTFQFSKPGYYPSNPYMYTSAEIIGQNVTINAYMLLIPGGGGSPEGWPGNATNWTGWQDENYTWYEIQVINRYSDPLENVRVALYLQNTTNATLTPAGISYTDNFGECQYAVLQKYETYYVNLSKDGYVTRNETWIPSPLDYYKTFMLDGDPDSSGGYQVTDAISVTAEMTSDGTLYVNITDFLGLIQDSQVYVYELDQSSGAVTLAASSSHLIDSSVADVFIFLNVSNTHRVEVYLNHSLFGFLTYTLFIVGEYETLTSEDEFNSVLEGMLGWCPFGWSNFIMLLGCVVVFFSSDRDELGWKLMLIGAGFFVMSYFVGFNNHFITWAGGIIPPLVIFCGFMIMWDDHRRGVRSGG